MTERAVRDLKEKHGIEMWNTLPGMTPAMVRELYAWDAGKDSDWTEVAPPMSKNASITYNDNENRLANLPLTSKDRAAHAVEVLSGTCGLARIDILELEERLENNCSEELSYMARPLQPPPNVKLRKTKTKHKVGVDRFGNISGVCRDTKEKRGIELPTQSRTTQK